MRAIEFKNHFFHCSELLTLCQREIALLSDEMLMQLGIALNDYISTSRFNYMATGEQYHKDIIAVLEIKLQYFHYECFLRALGYTNVA